MRSSSHKDRDNPNSGPFFYLFFSKIDKVFTASLGVEWVQNNKGQLLSSVFQPLFWPEGVFATHS